MDYPASLELWKLYPRLEPLPNDPKGLVRVVDEDGEDYLYPREYFRSMAIPKAVRALLRAKAEPGPPLQPTGSTRG